MGRYLQSILPSSDPPSSQLGGPGAEPTQSWVARDPAVDLVKRLCPLPPPALAPFSPRFHSGNKISGNYKVPRLSGGSARGHGGGLLLFKIGISGQTRSRRLIRNDHRTHLFSLWGEFGWSAATSLKSLSSCFRGGGGVIV